eukprot:1250410-Pleurochrysis_carterae.AAC.1
MESAIFIDCREDADHAAGGIGGAWHVPMGKVHRCARMERALSTFTITRSGVDRSAMAVHGVVSSIATRREVVVAGREAGGRVSEEVSGWVTGR